MLTGSQREGVALPPASTAVPIFHWTLRRFPTLLLMAFAFLLLSPTLSARFTARAQDERSRTDLTAWWWYHGVSPDQVNQIINDTGGRIIDIHVEQTSPYLFTVALVKNEGVFGKAWWWYFGLDQNGVNAQLQAHQARILELESYQVGGQTRFTVVLVPNTGADAKAWWWYFDATPDFIGSKLTENGARLIDLDAYLVGGSLRYSAVMIANQGADARTWFWYYGVSPDFISSALKQNNARLVDLDRDSFGNFDVIMERAQGEHWWWYFNVSESELNDLVAQDGARIIDVESFFIGGQKLFTAVLLNDSNALTTRIGDILRDNSDGASGLYLKQVNGDVLGALQERRVFEPASSIKVVEHLHAMLQVQNASVIRGGVVTVNTQIPWFTDYVKNPNGTDSSCPADTGPASEPLSNSLKEMMWNSDNRRAQAIRTYFGLANINATAQSVGMKDTQINHRIGCGEAATNHNRLTLYDAGLLYEGVAKGALLTPTNRTTFYSLMAGRAYDFTGIWSALQKIIDQEAAPLGIQPGDITSFKSQVELIYKAGGYGLSDGNYTSIAGRLQLPFRIRGTITPQQYVFGTFVNMASTNNKAGAAITAAPETLREPIQAALMTW